MASQELEALRKQIIENPTATDLMEARKNYDQAGLQFALPSNVNITKVDLANRPAELISIWRNREAARVILFLHGGGYALGSLDSHRYVAAEIARQTDAVVALLDYRLAPEHVYPAAVEDAVGAYLELSERFRGKPIALAGDSAGAGLSVAAMLALKEKGKVLPRCAYCMSPWADLACTGDSLSSHANKDPMVTKEMLVLFAGRYRGRADARTPMVSPIYGDLSGLPPLFIQVGTAEVLLDDSLMLAKAAAKADVQVSLEVWPEAMHLWQCSFPIVPEGQEALSRGCDFLKRHLA